jgi:ORF6N domain-containing protein
MASFIPRNSAKNISIESVIHSVRGEKVILDVDLARIYGVATKRLNEQVKRNIRRFPTDFAFRLNRGELEQLARKRERSDRSDNRSQIATGSQKHRNPRFLPYAFTEHGALMVANILNSTQAVEMSVLVVRAFVRMRRLLAAHGELTRQLSELERKVGTHDEQIQVIFETIRQLMAAPEPKKRKIGFVVEEKTAGYGRR